MPDPQPSLAERVRAAARTLEDAGWPADLARKDAEILARTVLDWDALKWITRQRETATSAFQALLDVAIDRRRHYEPIAYIAGFREFYGRTFRVTPDVLIPRPETELVIEQALARLGAQGMDKRGLTVADVGTGSGCLAITLALERPDIRVTATDISTAALAIAADNADRLGARDAIELVHTSLLEGQAGPFDLVVSNPPYVDAQDRDTLMPDVRDYEPGLALFGGNGGLEVIRELLPAVERALRPGGHLVMEIGAGQSGTIARLVETSAHLTLVHIEPDLAGIPRVVVAKKAWGLDELRTQDPGLRTL